MSKTAAAPRLLWPERKRCRKCRNFFCWTVIDRLFCSYECAGIEQPDPVPARWPRQHRTKFGVPKRAFFGPTEAEEFMRGHRITDKHPYHCGFCRMWHIGSNKSVPAAPVPAPIRSVAPWAGREGNR